MELLALGARFLELLGYVLAVLSVSILAAGVIWAFRSHVPQKLRLLFVAASLAVLAALSGSVLLWLVMSSQPPSPAIGKTPRTPRKNEAASDRDVSASQQPIEVYVEPDGTVFVQGKEVPLERLVSQLQQEHPNEQLSFVICPSADVPYAVVMQVVDRLKRQGAKDYTLRVAR